jgi:hypothetical protein
MRVDRWAMMILVPFLMSGSGWSQTPHGTPEPGVNVDPFPDFEFLPSPGQYTGRVFKLSQQYPTELASTEQIPDFFKIDFRTNWRDYLMQARAYCFQGNITPGGNVEDDWRVADETPPRWFHMPWQTYGPAGREGVHGLTTEAPIQPRQLAWTQVYDGGQTFAIGYYNGFGGYTIGQVWRDHQNPDISKASFRTGTVVFKLLFIDVPSAQVPSLVNPVEWTGYVPPSYGSTAPRVWRKLTLIQMDLMARDDRAPTGWVFGNFQYNGAMNRANRWENLVPVGVQWGNDPTITADSSNPMPVVTRRNLALKETIINDDDRELPPTHLGWNGRLCGPVDNPMSSCMSCHMTAQYPVAAALSPLFQDISPAPGSDAWMSWFRNISCGVPFSANAQSADNSLQLSISIQNCKAWQAEAKALSASAYHPTTGVMATKPKEISPFRIRINGKEQFKITRDVDP